MEEELITKEGSFQNTSTATIQEIHGELDVEIIEIGLLSDTLCKVQIKGTPAAINEILTIVDDPRNPPEENPEA